MPAWKIQEVRTSAVVEANDWREALRAARTQLGIRLSVHTPVRLTEDGTVVVTLPGGGELLVQVHDDTGSVSVPMDPAAPPPLLQLGAPQEPEEPDTDALPGGPPQPSLPTWDIEAPTTADVEADFTMMDGFHDCGGDPPTELVPLSGLASGTLAIACEVEFVDDDELETRQIGA